MPSKLHMTVPKKFRRNSQIPEILVLHRADLNEGDVQDAHGVKVTRPLRTILDVLETGRVDKTQIGQAIEAALRRGLIRKQQIDSLPHDKAARFVSRTRGTTVVTDEAREYKTAGAFRAALEARLQSRAHDDRPPAVAQAGRL